MVCTLDQARIHMIQARAQLSPAADSTQAALVNQAVRVDRIRRAESAVHQLTSVLEPAVDESSDDEDDALKQLSVMMGITPNPQGVSQTSHCPSSSSSSSLDSNSDEADDILSTWIEKTTFWRGYGVASLAQWISKRNASDTSARDFDTLDCLPEVYTDTYQSVCDYLVNCFGYEVGSITSGPLDPEDVAHAEGWGRSIVTATSTMQMRVYPRGVLAQEQSGQSLAHAAPPCVVITTRNDFSDHSVVATAVLFNPAKICSLMERANPGASSKPPVTPPTAAQEALNAQLQNAHHRRSEVAIMPLWCSDSVCRGVLPFGLIDCVPTMRALADSEAKYAGGIFTYGIASKLCSAGPVGTCKAGNSPSRWVEQDERLLSHCQHDALLATGVRTVARTIVRTLGLYHVLAYGTLDIACGAQPHAYKSPLAIPALIGVCVHMALDRQKISALGPLTPFEEEALRLFRADWLCEAVPLERAANGHVHYALDHLTASVIETAQKMTRNEGKLSLKAAVAHCGCLAAMGLHLVRLVYTPLIPDHDDRSRWAEQPDVFAFDPMGHNQTPQERRRHATRVRDALLDTLFRAEHALRRPLAQSMGPPPPRPRNGETEDETFKRRLSEQHEVIVHRIITASPVNRLYAKKREVALHAGIHQHEARHWGQEMNREAVERAVGPIAQIVKYGAAVVSQAYSLHAHLVAPTVSQTRCCVCDQSVHVLQRLLARPFSSCDACHRLVCFECQLKAPPTTLTAEWHCPTCRSAKRVLTPNDLKCIEAVKQKLSSLVTLQLTELVDSDAVFRAGVEAFAWDCIKSDMEVKAVNCFFDAHHAVHGSEGADEEAIDVGSLGVSSGLAVAAVGDAALLMRQQIVNRLDMGDDVGQLV